MILQTFTTYTDDREVDRERGYGDKGAGTGVKRAGTGVKRAGTGEEGGRG